MITRSQHSLLTYMDGLRQITAITSIKLLG